MNACSVLYNIAQPPPAGSKPGVCRITGEASTGIPFDRWVKDTFTNFDSLFPGTIISNEALFCFDESSLLIQKKTGRDKPQRFRTYSHIITKNGEWLALTKADKKQIVELILSGNVNILCLTDSGQKHVFFKHKMGFWQLDDSYVAPNIPDFAFLHSEMQSLLALGFGQEQVKSGRYHQAQIIKVGISAWHQIESKLKPRRGEPIFDLAAWLMFTNKNMEE